MGKYGIARQTTDENIRRMRIACWILKATDTHSEYVTHYFSTTTMVKRIRLCVTLYRGADKSFARSGRKQATPTEDFDVHISYL